MLQRFMFLPPAASEHAPRLDFMLELVHWLMLLLFVGWSVYFAVVLVRFRASRNPRASYEGAQGKPAKWAEVGVVIAEAILLLGFSFPLWAERVEAFPQEREATVVHVVGEQFAWNVHYPGADGVFGRRDPAKVDVQTNPLGLDRSDPAAADDIVTLNQLHLPVNRPAIIHLSSKDVIHSFALWEMRVKQDAIPGLSIPVWFTPTVTTEEMRRRTGNPEYNFEIGCAQLCGLGHYRMRGFLTVETPEEFEAWLAEQARYQLGAGEEEEFWQ